MKLMIVVGSVRPGRAGLPVGEWVRSRVEADGRFELDWADLLEIDLPWLDEPNHPAKRQYTKAHTIAWSERVDAADAFIFVTPEYNHSYSPALKNAFDFLYREWWRKPIAFVSYGGVAGGARGVAAFDPVYTTVGAVKTMANVEIPFVATMITDGTFVPSDRETAILGKVLDELESLSVALTPLRG
ncbi:MAG: NAD(P)H-dependent oxidoreductase [Salinibacterium sp.]|nr:NAD(P)H-dependent oxidoreductase [Salinibacterium sp.]